MGNYCFGIDVGGTSVKCGLFMVEGTVLDKWELPTHKEEGGSHILLDIAESVQKKMEEKDLTKEDIQGIGIGVPGPVDENGCVACAVNLHWGYKDIVGELAELTGIPVKAANDANAAALGELWQGGGAGCQSIVMVTLGTGVGGGIIINEQIVSGFHGVGGEIGHIHVDDNITERCNCGKSGCLEQVASATGIVWLARKVLATSVVPSILREEEDISAKAVFDAVKVNDALAIQIAEEFGHYLGKALAGVSCVVDPQAFVIGGGVSKAGPVLLRFIEKNYRKHAFPASRETKFALAMLGNDAGIYGAAKMVC